MKDTWTRCYTTKAWDTRLYGRRLALLGQAVLHAFFPSATRANTRSRLAVCVAFHQQMIQMLKAHCTGLPRSSSRHPVQIPSASCPTGESPAASEADSAPPA